MKKQLKQTLSGIVAASVLFSGGIVHKAYAVENNAVTVGDFRLSGGTESVDYSFSNDVLTILSGTKMTIGNVDPSTPTEHRIMIPKGVKAELVFDGVNIATAANCPVTLTPDANGQAAQAHIILADNSVNKLHAKGPVYAGLRAGESTTLIIDDAVVNRDAQGNFVVPESGKVPRDLTLENGTTLKKGDLLTKMDSKNPGRLEAIGSYNGAGIGGAGLESGGNITINGGVINASIADSTSYSAFSAGIGGGSVGDGGNITINGGKITASGSYHGAGIGGGCHSYTGTYGTAVEPTPINIIREDYYRGCSGNITINGGRTYSHGNVHADAFGDGCMWGTGTGWPNYSKENYKIIVTGGTIIPYGTSGRYDLSAQVGDVIITGGSLRAEQFRSRGKAEAFGDMEKKTHVFMSKVSYEYLGKDKVNTTLVEDFKMKVNGMEVPYGAPSYTDDKGMLYLWFNDNNKGAEVSVDAPIRDAVTGDVLYPESFYIENVGPDTPFLKQYHSFTINPDLIRPGLIKKRYDGLPFGEEVSKDFIKDILSNGGIPVSNPAGKALTDADQMSIVSHLLDETTMKPDPNAQNDDLSKRADVGKYQLIITSTQYASEPVFKDSYWGHRATYNYAEITPADTEVSVQLDKKQDIKPGDPLHLEITVSPAKNEGINCAAPKGAVQVYIDGVKVGDPITLEEHNVQNPTKHNSSTATIDLDLLKGEIPNFHNNMKITVEYLGVDKNYNHGSKQDIGIGLDLVDVDVDGDGIPDVNIDTDGDGKPDVNIDTDGDLNPEINLDTDNTGTWKPSKDGGNADKVWKPDTSIDTNGDGEGDLDYRRDPVDKDGNGVDDGWHPNKDVDKDGFIYDTAAPHINVDIDGDGIPDVNIDTDGDGKPDVNIDTDGDLNPEINLDTDNTGTWKPSKDGGNADKVWKPDTSIDTNGDGKGDTDHRRDPVDKDGNGVDDGWHPNKDVDKDGFIYDTAAPHINVDIDGDGIPDVNIDTDGDGKPDVNIDTDGDLNPEINLDTDNTGTWKPSKDGGNADKVWKPDTSIDTNGDGEGDLDYRRDPVDKDGNGVDDGWHPNKDVDKDGFIYDTAAPHINVDIDGDGIPDVNIDTDGDGKPDVNIDTDGDLNPEINLDTDNTGTWKPSKDGGNADKVWKPDTSIDTNGDGEGDLDYRRDPVDKDGNGVDDGWHPNKDVDKDGFIYDTAAPHINVDIDGDGIPDVNIDTDGDGKPDVNIDTDGDLNPEINLDTDNTGTWKPSKDGGNADKIWKPDTSIDTDGDGEGDLDYRRDPVDKDGNGVDDGWYPNKDVDKDGFIYDTGDPHINVDVDGDRIPDVNIDMDGDGKPDINVDIDDDGIPDINIDTDRDGKPDVNIDTDGDLNPEINLDTDNTGTWKPSKDGGNADKIWKPDTSIETDGDGKGDTDHRRDPVDKDGNGVDDGWHPNKDADKDGFIYDTAAPHINVDIDGDGIPDVNIDTDGDGKPDVNIDTDGDLNPEINLDTDNTGTWKPSKDGGNADKIWKPDTSIDTDGDGKGDTDHRRDPVDKDGNGVDDGWHPNKDVDKNGFIYDTGAFEKNDKPDKLPNTGDTSLAGYALLSMVVSCIVFVVLAMDIKRKHVK